MTQFGALFSSFQLGNLKLRNRIVMPPMATHFAGEASEYAYGYYKHLLGLGGTGAGLHALFQKGIHFVLSGEEDFEVTGETTGNGDAISLIDHASSRLFSRRCRRSRLQRDAISPVALLLWMKDITPRMVAESSAARI